MGPGVYYPNMPNGTAGMMGHQVPHGMEEFFAAQQYANSHYLAQHVNLASIDPTMAMSVGYGYQGGDYHAPSYPPTLSTTLCINEWQGLLFHAEVPNHPISQVMMLLTLPLLAHMRWLFPPR